MLTSGYTVALKNNRINTLIYPPDLSRFMEKLLPGMGMISVLTPKGGDINTKIILPVYFSLPIVRTNP